jgi:pentatricopeptide repeat protein
MNTLIVCVFLLVNSYARNGMGTDAIALYRQMPEKIRDEVSHVCVLNACSHSGLIDEARVIFNGISSKTEQVICTMVGSARSLLRIFIRM